MQNENSVNGSEKQLDWHAVNWRRAHRIVRNLRQRIFRAAKDGDLQKVASLQKLLLRSRSNALVSVRQVTQVNHGKNTAGVDRVVVKTPAARSALVEELGQLTPWQAHPARRIYIPKANGKLRPLGIPVIRDRCLQAMVKNALEPFWEARFEGISYGFRPGRSSHDAIAKIYLLAQPHKTKRWVVDADIKGAFDHISHDFLLQAIGQFPARALIKQWLQAGYLEGDAFHPTESGTPQGGVISPLLANIALHGMEAALTVTQTLPNGHTVVTAEGVKYNTAGRNVGQLAVVRYADDFVVFCATKEAAEKTIETLRQWLQPRGLELSPEKTRIVHLTEGFDFLGFNVRLYSAPQTTRTGWKLLIKPSRASITKIREKLRQVWFGLQGQNAPAAVRALNPIVRGWANYFRIAVASQTFRKLDDWMFKRAVRYARRNHPKKSATWMAQRYFGAFHPQHQDKWVFGDKDTGMHVLKFSWFKIERHVLVRANASPDDATLRDYWAQRNCRHAQDLKPSRTRLAQRQRGCCLHCGETLFGAEAIELHHKIPKAAGGTESYANLELVHYFCHQQIHQTGK
jgi:RNA-directed DNA polymerase